MKKILLVVCLLLLSGCTTDYNLEIKNSKIKENIYLEVSEKDYNNYINSQEEKENLSLNEYFNNVEILSFREDVTEKHVKSIKNIDDKLQANYSYEYDYVNFIDSYIINNCFEKYTVINKDSYYYIELSGKFNCYYNKTTINVTTDRKVYNENAKSKKDNTYTWEINDSNKNSVNIIFQIAKDYSSSFNDLDKKESSNILSIILFCLLGFIVSAVIIFFKRKSKNSI